MTPPSTQDLEALKALAEKATPGEWACGRDLSHFDAPELVKADGAFYVGVKMEDAAFIAAFNPQTALALLADNERLKEHITALEAEKAEARADNERLSAIVSGDLKKAYLLSAGPDYAKGGFEMVFRSPIGAFLAEFFAECLKAEGAENFLAISANHDELGPIEFSIQRQHGETMVAQLSRVKAEAAEARRLALEEAEQAMHALKDKRSGADLSAQNAWSDGIAAIIALKERT